MNRPPKSCPTIDCPGVGTRQHSKDCEHGRRAQRRAIDRKRASAAARGYDARWRATRAAFLATHPICEHCPAPATEADHRDGLGPLGPRGHDEDNLRALCKPCHSRRTAADQPGGWNR